MSDAILEAESHFIGPQSPQETEFKKLLEFLDTNLRQGHNWSIASEYPTALNLNNLHNVRMILNQEGQICASAVLKPLIVKSPLLPIKVGAIGSVVTESSYRNKGLSTQILQDCLALAQKQDCDVAILWTNLYDFYRKLGFELAGTEVSSVIDQEFAAPAGGYKFLDNNKISPEALMRIYSQHTVQTHRSVEDLRKFLQIPNTRVHTAWDPSGALAAYAIEGKGADLTGYIHEWGGNTPALMSLLSHIRKQKGAPITIILPRHSLNLIKSLQQQGFKMHDGFLGMIKILNHDALFNRIKKAARSTGFADLVLEKRGSHFLIGYGTEVLETEQEAEVLKLIFGPATVRELLPLDHKTTEVLAKIFPLPFWIWGWDSI